MDIEQFANLRVELERGAALDAVLAREGLTHLQWLVHERRWLRALVGSMHRGDRSLADRYAAAFGAPGVDAAEAEPQPATELEKSSSPPLAAPHLGSPSEPAAASVIPAAHQAAAPSAPAVAAPTPKVGVDETSFVGLVNVAEALPFRGDGETSSSPPVAADAAAKVVAGPQPMVGETAEVSVLTAADLAEALPFGGGAAPSEPARAATPSPNQPARAVEAPRAAEVTSTDETGFVPYIKPGPTLGFQAVADQRPPPPAAAQHAAAGADLVGATAEVGVLSAEDLAEATPFDQSSDASPSEPAPSGELTLEQYASLRCELEQAPRARGEVLASYGIASEDAFSEVNHAWAARFRDDPGMYGHFRAAYDRYSAWLNTAEGS